MSGAPVELVVFVGLQASGKSTFYRQRFAATHALVSKDLLRNNARPERRQRRLVTEALAAGRSVVVDNTNPTVADRAALVALGRAAGARVVAFVFDTPIEVCLARNAARTGRDRVPPVALYTTRKRMQALSFAEGFNAVTDVRLGPDGVVTLTPRTPAAARAALEAAALELADADALDGVALLVGLLLDGDPPLRRAVAETLGRWPRHPPHAEVVAAARRRLKPDEAALLDG